MEFGLSENQRLLKDNARKFFAGECPMNEVRRIMETDTAYDAGLWAKMADQGYTGIIFPEQYGGVGLGKVEFILLMEEAGRALLPGPLFSTVAYRVAWYSSQPRCGTPGGYRTPRQSRYCQPDVPTRTGIAQQSLPVRG